MKPIIRHTLLLLAAITIAVTPLSCRSDKRDEPSIETPRTVLVYMVAQNNLSTYSYDDIFEMSQAARQGHIGKSRLLLYHDPMGAEPQLYEMMPDGTKKSLLQYNDDILSVTAERMNQVILDAKRLAPARRYGIIFWGHGTGYKQNGIEQPKGITPLSYGGETENRRDNWMNTTVMREVLRGKGFDWIYFDCCFMAGVEVAYELRDVTSTIIASVTEIPGAGMPYDATLQYLMPQNTDPAKAAAATFGLYNSKVGINRTCTMSVIKTDALRYLAAATQAILRNTPGLPPGAEIQEYMLAEDRDRYGWHYYDFAHYIRSLATDASQLANFNAALDKAVTFKVATPYLWGTLPLVNHSGLSTLIIESPNDPLIDTFNYRQLQWWRDVVSLRFN